MFSNMYVHIINTLVFYHLITEELKSLYKKNIVKTLVKINLYIHNYIKIVPLSFFFEKLYKFTNFTICNGFFAREEAFVNYH